MSQMVEVDSQEHENVEWLPHLTSEVVADAKGWNLDAYVIALEGWRRGLTLKWHVKESGKFKDMKTWNVDTPGKLFTLSSKNKTHWFFRTRGDKVSNEAVDIGSNKEITKQFLSKIDIRVPKGERFSKDQSNDAIIKYASSLGYPVVLKPTNGSFGRGVVTNIKSQKALNKALLYVRSELKYFDVIVEQHIQGEEYRIYVVGNQAVGAIRRIPSNVIGDGTNSIRTLIVNKNEERKTNPRLDTCPIDLNQANEEFINKFGYTLNFIPEQGQKVFLGEKSNISQGGDPFDVFDELSTEVKNTAVKALQAIPGLEHGAVDLMINPNELNKDATIVLEINPTAQIGSLLFPLKGKARDIPAAIIDYYFPETVEINMEKSKIYFDFNDVLTPLINKIAIKTEVTPCQLNVNYGKKYVVSRGRNMNYHRMLRKHALENNLMGFIELDGNRGIEIVVVGPDLSAVEQFRDIIVQETKWAKVSKISEENWDKPIKMGFEIKGTRKNLTNELRMLNKTLEQIKNDQESHEIEYEKMLTSRSWRYTSPIRKITGTIKEVYRTRLKGFFK